MNTQANQITKSRNNKLQHSTTGTLTVRELRHILFDMDQDATVHFCKEREFGEVTSSAGIHRVEEGEFEGETFITLN